MERKHFEMTLVGLTFVMTLALLFLRTMFVSIGTVWGTEATSILMPSFIFYAVVMIGIGASLLTPIGMRVDYSEATVKIDKVSQQEWVVDAEIKLDDGFSELQDLVAKGDHDGALKKYKELDNIYKWVKGYEVSEDKQRNYYLLLDSLKTKIDMMDVKK